MSNVVKTIAKETKVLKDFIHDFSRLRLEFEKFLNSGEKLKRTQKEDLRDFREDIPAFENFIKSCEDREKKFKLSLEKGVISPELYSDWKENFNEAKNLFRAFVAEVKFCDQDISIAEDEQYEKDEFFTVQGIKLIYNTYVSPLYRRYKVVKENDDLNSESEKE